jgi:hypothetical protein
MCTGMSEISNLRVVPAAELLDIAREAQLAARGRQQHEDDHFLMTPARGLNSTFQRPSHAMVPTAEVFQEALRALYRKAS